MFIASDQLQGSPASFIGNQAIVGTANAFGGFKQQYCLFSWSNKVASTPQGYRFGKGALNPMATGGLSANASGSGAMTTDMTAIAYIAGLLAGSGGVTSADLKMGRAISALLAGSGNLTLSMTAIANISAIIRIGASPSVEDIKQGILNALKTDFNNPGTIGEAINDAGAGGDPWSVDIVAGGYSGNQAGKKLKDSADDAFAAKVKP